MRPEEIKQFCQEDYFTIKLSSKFWCGIWSNMTIEQTLMCSTKTPSVLICWVLGTPIVSTINNQIEKLENTYNFTYERDSRIKIDNEHMEKRSN